MSDSKRSSKSDLNESNMPLLDDEKAAAQEEDAAGEKENIEMGEKEDKGKEKKEKKKKEKKEKKPKEPKGPGCIEVNTADLNLKDRDEKSINVEIDLGFDDVLAEPDSAQGFDGVWRLSFLVFSRAKLWIYRLLSALIALPAALVWALVFAVVTVVYVWFIAPLLRLVEFGFFLVRRVFGGFIRAALEPFYTAIGTCFSGIRVNINHTQSVQQV